MATVLIIEDEKEINERVQRAIQALGHDIIAATRMDHALNIVENIPDIDLILLDLMMPSLPGFLPISTRVGLDALGPMAESRREATAGTSFNKSLPPVIVFTAVTELVDQANESEAIVDVISKGNYNWEDELVASVKELL